MNRHQHLGWRCKLAHVSGVLDFLSPQIQDIMAPADLIIFQRNIIHPVFFDAIKYWQGLGKPVVVDLDDDYAMLPHSNPAKQFWHRNPFEGPDGVTESGGALKMLEEGLRISNGLISPNRTLLKVFEHVAGNTYYLQNYAEPGWWNNLPDRATLKKERGLEGRIIIGWGGSVSHYDSFWGSGVMEAAGRVSSRHPEVIWLLCGNDQRLYNHLPVSPTQKMVQGGVPPEQWPRTVAGFDIGIAPLFGPYDQRRSWIKGIEYLLGGVPWIGTEGEPYRDIEHLGTLIPGGADAWEEALEAKIKNLKAEQEQAVAFIPTAQQLFFVDNQLDAFHKVYSQVKADFQEDQHTALPGVFYVRKQVNDDRSNDQAAEVAQESVEAAAVAAGAGG